VAAGIMAVFIMLLMLLTQFNSFYQSFIILTSVTISFVGVLLGLLITGKPFSTTMTGLSIVTLAGIVVNNNIVLIDAYQRFREHGYEPVDAAVRTAAQRLRPVFLTTLTTVVGLMPLILGWGANIFTGELDTRGTSTSEIWAPISFVVASGLGFATILTLIVTPVLLAAPTVLGERAKQYYKKLKDGDTKKSRLESAE